MPIFTGCAYFYDTGAVLAWVSPAIKLPRPQIGSAILTYVGEAESRLCDLFRNYMYYNMQCFKRGLRLAVLALSLLVLGARCDYTLEVRAVEYDNNDHKLANGRCCERENRSDRCTPWWCYWCECDMSFKFCMRPPATAHDDNPGNCDLGRYATGEVSTDDDRFTFSTPIASGVPNPMTFSGSVWPVSPDRHPDIKSIYIAAICCCMKFLFSFPAKF